MSEDPFNTDGEPRLFWELTRRTGRALDRLAPWFGIALIVLGLLSLHHTNRQLAKTEHGTCQIQSVGLQAQRELTPVLEGINVLIQQPDRRNPLARKLPKQPPTPAYYLPALKELRFHLPRYLALEHKQPASRKC